jgi:undecaprenyl-diphosphatase
VTLLEAIILGLIEGISEYLPISSTGHLIIAKSLLGLDGGEQSAAVDAFLIVVQGGAILAVLGLYRTRVAQMISGVLGKNPVGRRLAFNLMIAFLPAAVLGVLLDEVIERLLFKPAPVVLALALGGVVMLLAGRWQRRHYHRDDAAHAHDSRHVYRDIEDLSWRHALLIGFLQCLAMWPGTSRSMVTILGGMATGMRPRQAAEFSFLLGLPTLGGACVYKLAKDLSREESMFETLGVVPVLVGIAVATVSAGLAIRWLVDYLSRHGLAIFGWYRIVLSIVLVVLLTTGVITVGGDAGGGDTAIVNPPPTLE